MVADATHVVLPGVGSFGAADGRLREAGLDAALPRGSRPAGRRWRSASAISCCSRPATRAPVPRALRYLSGQVGRFPERRAGAAVRLEPGRGRRRLRLIEPGYAYFANSYRGTDAPGWARRDGRARRALRRGDGAGRRARLPVPSRAVGRLRRGAARALAGARLMLTARIIPCLDVSHGRVVKGVRFQGLRDAGDPAERAALYEHQGADEIVILDVSATPEGRGNQLETVRRVRAVPRHPAHGRRRRAHGRGRARPARGRRRQGLGQHRRGGAAGAAERDRRAVRAAVRVIAIDAAQRDGRLRGAGQGRARGHRHRRGRVGAGGGPHAAPARCCSPAGTATARARATTWR